MAAAYLRSYFGPRARNKAVIFFCGETKIMHVMETLDDLDGSLADRIRGPFMRRKLFVMQTLLSGCHLAFGKGRRNA